MANKNSNKNSITVVEYLNDKNNELEYIIPSDSKSHTGACARLKKGEPIDKLLYGGYSTISLGYAGLAVKAKAELRDLKKLSGKD